MAFAEAEVSEGSAAGNGTVSANSDSAMADSQARKIGRGFVRAPGRWVA